MYLWQSISASQASPSYFYLPQPLEMRKQCSCSDRQQALIYSRRERRFVPGTEVRREQQEKKELQGESGGLFIYYCSRLHTCQTSPGNNCPCRSCSPRTTGVLCVIWGESIRQRKRRDNTTTSSSTPFVFRKYTFNRNFCKTIGHQLRKAKTSFEQVFSRMNIKSLICTVLALLPPNCQWHISRSIPIDSNILCLPHAQQSARIHLPENPC